MAPASGYPYPYQDAYARASVGPGGAGPSSRSNVNPYYAATPPMPLQPYPLMQPLDREYASPSRSSIRTDGTDPARMEAYDSRRLDRHQPVRFTEAERSGNTSEHDSNGPERGSGAAATTDGGGGKVKRAKSAQKITRNRKITSCLQCRERKQKCDRTRPVCTNCMAGNSRGGMCTYVDTVEGVQEVLANEGVKDAKRIKRSPSPTPFQQASQSQRQPPQLPQQQQEHAPPVSSSDDAAGLLQVRSSLLRPMLPARSPLTIRRLNLIAASSKAGRDPSLDFESRVRYARAAALGTILFGTPSTEPFASPSQLYQPLAAVDSLKLPTASEVGSLLDTYRRHVEWMTNVVIVDLNRARIESFLNWWHSNPQTLPADPPLIPLVLTVLALALQARRMAPHCTLPLSARNNRASSAEKGRKGGRHGRTANPTLSNDPAVSAYSSEKELLETAQRCIDVLQIACPSNWASAFSAPLDLVRASMLRGLWHVTELHLQFAGSCFATTMRLAHAASLHHDTKHWPSMGKEESQARRNIFYNIAAMEISFSLRVIQPSVILPSSYDTKFPDDYDALLNLYRYGGLIEPHIFEGRRSHLRVSPVTRASFHFYLARFRLTDILVKGQEALRSGDKASLAESHERWKQALPEDMRAIIAAGGSRTLGDAGLNGAKRDYGIEVPLAHSDNNLDHETHYQQAALLQMMDLSVSIQIHRPQADNRGQWRAPEGCARQSLDVCLDSSRRLIWLIESVVLRDPGPSYVLYRQCVFHCFQAAIILAIEGALSPDRDGEPATGVALRKAIDLLEAIATQTSLRYVAEQAGRYGNTLKEIQSTGRARRGRPTTAQRPTKRGAMQNGQQKAASNGNSTDGEQEDSLTTMDLPRTALGVPSLPRAEGDGKMLGGQGYPAGRPTPSSATASSRLPPSRPSVSGIRSPAKESGNGEQTTATVTPGNAPVRFSDTGKPLQTILPELQTLPMPTVSFLSSEHNAIGMVGPSQGFGPIPSMQTLAPQSTFGIDFSDLQVFGPTDPSMRFDGLAEDSFGERHLSHATVLGGGGGQGGPGSSSTSGSNPTTLTSLDGAGPIDTGKQGGKSTAARASTMVPYPLQLLTSPPQSGEGGQVGNGLLDTSTPSTMGWQAQQQQQQQVGQSGAMDGDGMTANLDDAFAMDWGEWERAVERMLYMDR